MIDGSLIVDSFVDKLRNIPEYVERMGGDPERIYAYHDSYPAENTSLLAAIHEMPVPGTMAVWSGMQPASRDGMDAWQHQLSVIIRMGEPPAGNDPPSGYYRLFWLLYNGVPSGQEQRMRNVDVHPSCYPMNAPSFQRQTDIEGLDYFEATVTYDEIGDE